jgi:hypothetical protein
MYGAVYLPNPHANNGLDLSNHQSVTDPHSNKLYCLAYYHPRLISIIREGILVPDRVIVAIENTENAIAISARPYGMRAVLKFAHYTGAQSIARRFTPGTFTNQITKQFRKRRLLIVTDPRNDS